MAQGVSSDLSQPLTNPAYPVLLPFPSPFIHLCCPGRSGRAVTKVRYTLFLFSPFSQWRLVCSPQLTRYKSEVHTFSLLTVLPSKPSSAIGGLGFTVTKVTYTLFLFSPFCPSVFEPRCSCSAGDNRATFRVWNSTHLSR